MPPEDYRLTHRAPADDGYSAPVTQALTRFGPDVLDQPDLYGNTDAETLAQLRAAVTNPDGFVRIYRAVPPQHLEINTGDWVTLSRAYAHQHGYHDPDGPDWPVVYADVPAATVFTDGNDPSEYGYTGPARTHLTPLHESDPDPPPVATTTRSPAPVLADPEDWAARLNRATDQARRSAPTQTNPAPGPGR